MLFFSGSRKIYVDQVTSQKLSHSHLWTKIVWKASSSLLTQLGILSQIAILFMQVTCVRITVARLSPAYLALGILSVVTSLCLSTPEVTILYIFWTVQVVSMLSEAMLEPLSCSLARIREHDLFLSPHCLRPSWNEFGEVVNAGYPWTTLNHKDLAVTEQIIHPGVPWALITWRELQHGSSCCPYALCTHWAFRHPWREWDCLLLPRQIKPFISQINPTSFQDIQSLFFSFHSDRYC